MIRRSHVNYHTRNYHNLHPHPKSPKNNPGLNQFQPDEYVPQVGWYKEYNTLNICFPPSKFSSFPSDRDTDYISPTYVHAKARVVYLRSFYRQ